MTNHLNEVYIYSRYMYTNIKSLFNHQSHHQDKNELYTS